jgi:hypothetical protein
MKKIIAAVLGLIVIFLVILGVNTAMFTSKQGAVGSIDCGTGGPKTDPWHQ